ncbi:cytochrome c553 [Litoreibacter ponti]|uniref:Cytochrome c553 n=1 Tax=Litoreibacter ponti TaxID=1510457 RepID=A0A2T6BHE7_9RHOB|nr:c-type cytochrome [Litoreibacter ponti]PTX55485.1 cytochrome c553 [Litoreibacter ponti]
MRLALTLALGGVFLAGAVLSEADRAAGRKVAGMCRTCHGLDGFALIPIAPHIGGEPAAYLAAQLKAFRDGSREHEMMTVVARGLSDAQIADVAAWYAGHTVTVSHPEPAENAPELCTACHGSDGISLVEDAPNLAAETNIYIETQLKAFRNGQRASDIMAPIASEISDEDLRDIANWYAAAEIEIKQVDAD